jgi:hypothetical protein
MLVEPFHNRSNLDMARDGHIATGQDHALLKLGLVTHGMIRRQEKAPLFGGFQIILGLFHRKRGHHSNEANLPSASARNTQRYR